MLRITVTEINTSIVGADSSANTTFLHVVGNKADAAATGVVTATDSMMAYIKQLVTDTSTVLGAVGGASLITGTSDSGTTTTLVDATLTQANDEWIGQTLVMTSGDNLGKARPIVDFVAATDTITVEPAFIDAIGTDTYTIVPRSAWAEVMIGTNSADNAADTSAVVANANGSVLERLEHIVTQLLATGDIHDVLYADAAGASITVDLIALQADLDAGGDIHDVLYADATGVSIAADIIAMQADLDAGGDIHDVLYADAAGASIAVDIIAMQADLDAGGDIHDVLYADAAGASVAVDIIAMQADLDAGGDIHDVLYADAAGASVAVDIIAVKAETANILTDTGTTIPATLTAGVPQMATVQTVDGSATPWTQAAHRLFTVTGVAMVRVFGVIDETLVGAATLELGVASATAGLIAQVADATTLAAGDILANSGTATLIPLGQTNEYAIVSGTDIDITVASANVTDGQITFYVQWLPVSVGATVAAAAWD